MDRSRLIIIPAYNEADTIKDIVRKASAFGMVVVTDDHSTDETAKIARDAGAQVLSSETNLGYEEMLNRGFAYAMAHGFESIVTIDADGEHDPSLIEAFFVALTAGHNALVLGIRPRKQRFSEIVMGWYFRRVFGVDDILCGMKGYRLATLKTSKLAGGAHVGTGAVIEALRRREPFTQIHVWGRPRADSPRFGDKIRGNIKIFGVFFRILVDDLLLSCKQKPRRAIR